MRIQHNIAALNSYNRLGSNNNAVSKNLEKLSSGYRINRAGDDAAGLAISEKMRAQIKGLETAQKNANDGISLVQTAEGALTEVHSMLNRMVELATQSSNGTYDNEVDRANLQKEVSSLIEEIDRISESTNYNGIQLLDGSLGGGKAGRAGEMIYTGASIAKFEQASKDGVTNLADLDNINVTNGTTGDKEYFIVDGQKLAIDWTQGDGKIMADALKTFGTSAKGGTATAEQAKDMASKLTDFFNSQMEEQGLSGSVKITTNAAGDRFTLASNNKGADSEFSFAGLDDMANAATSVGSLLFDSVNNSSSGTAGGAVINKAQVKYNGEAITAGDRFQMEINGVKLTVNAPAIAKDADISEGSVTANNLQTAIQAAIGKYNTELGLTAGVKDPTSGLTGLTAADFKADFDKNGSLIVKYTGDVENVNFSFDDIGDGTTASKLGLGSGSSKLGGGRGLDLQVGDTNQPYQKVTVSIDSMSTKSLGIADIDISTQDGAAAAIDKVKAAINTVSSTRGDLGAIQNRLEHTINNLSVTTENLTAAESRIRDVDMAKEMMDFTKNNILVQASQAMLAQANQIPQGVLQLLQ